MVTFYLDEDIPDDLAPLLQNLGNTAYLTRAVGRKGTDDYQQLWLAAARGWLLITRNGRDYERLHRAWHLWGVPRPHGGIVIAPQVERSRYRSLAEELHDLASTPVEFFGRMLLTGRRILRFVLAARSPTG